VAAEVSTEVMLGSALLHKRVGPYAQVCVWRI
jgi:hypothetical protein